MNYFRIPLVTNAVMNTNIASAGIPLLEIIGYAIQAEFTGTPTGTFKLQASNDNCPKGPQPPVQPTNWTDIANSPYTVSASGDYMWNVSWTQYNWVRLVYTDTSGGTSTAVLNSVLNAKGL